MSIQSVSFGKTVTTKNGNEYKKSHAGTITGAAAGFGVGTFLVYNCVKPKAPMAIKRSLAKAYIQLKQIVPKQTALKLTKKVTFPLSLATAVGVYTAAGLGIGALVNKAINHHKAKVADKKAATAKAE